MIQSTRKRIGPRAGLLLAALAVAALAGCVSSPARPGTGTPGTPTTPGTPGTATGTSPGTSPAPGESAGNGSSRESGGVPAPTRGATTPGTQETAGAPQQGGERPEQKRQSDSARSGSPGDRSDDQILADALADFERRNAPAGGNTGQTETDAKATATGAGPGTTPGAAAGATAGDPEQRLEEQFAEFDRVMLSEREGVKRADDTAGNRGFDDRDTFSRGEGDAEGEGEAMQTAMVDRDRGISSPGLPGRIENDEGSVSAIPADVANIQDDDIIARQLREAAMKERDPELREKLWDEYRRYKRGK